MTLTERFVVFLGCFSTLLSFLWGRPVLGFVSAFLTVIVLIQVLAGDVFPLDDGEDD